MRTLQLPAAREAGWVRLHGVMLLMTWFAILVLGIGCDDATCPRSQGCGEGTGVVIVDIDPDSIEASWALCLPCENSVFGNADRVISGVDPGPCILAWLDTPGWVTPEPNAAMQMLAAGDTVSFLGVYTSVCVDSMQIQVDAKENTVREAINAAIYVPSGTFDFTVEVDGTAFWAPDCRYAMLMMEYKDDGVSIQVPVRIGGSVTTATSNPGYPLQFFFVDGNLSDNSGSVEVTVASSFFDTLRTTVSAIEHCQSDEHVASVELPPSSWRVSATGSASWGGSTQFQNVILMYEDALEQPNRYFQEVAINGPSAEINEFNGGSVRLFFADTGGVGDNHGTVDVSFSCGAKATGRGPARD